MLIRDLIEVRPNGEIWYNIYSNIKEKCILQVETGDVFDTICMRYDDPHQYKEVNREDYLNK